MSLSLTGALLLPSPEDRILPTGQQHHFPIAPLPGLEPSTLWSWAQSPTDPCSHAAGWVKAATVFCVVTKGVVEQPIQNTFSDVKSVHVSLVILVCIFYSLKLDYASKTSTKYNVNPPEKPFESICTYQISNVFPPQHLKIVDRSGVYNFIDSRACGLLWVDVWHSTL